MRIGIVAPEFPPDIGGVETYAHEFSLELARRGHEVFVFTCPHPNGEISGQGFEVLPILKVQYTSDRQLPQKYPMDVWHVMNAAYSWLALETQPLIMSVHGNDFIDPYFLPRLPNLSHIPGLWRLSLPLRPLRRWLWRKTALRLMRRGLSHATQVITNSEYTKKLLSLRYPDTEGKTSVGYVGVGEDFFRTVDRRGSKDKTKRLVTVCRLAEPRKNVDKILRSLARLKHYPFQYTLIGDGNLRFDLESLCRQLDLDQRVTCTGFLPKTEIQKILAESDLFVLASAVLPDSIEGFGIVYLEANACGTPVLAARAAGAAEAVNEGKTGYFVDEPTVPAITAALERFLKGEIHFQRADCKAFANRFNWAKVVDHAMQFYLSGQREKTFSIT